MAALSTHENIEYTKHIVEVYDAIIMTGNNAKVIETCRLLPDGPFQRITMHGSTVLHKAAYSEQCELVLQLLEMVSTETHQKMINRTDYNDGGTILHEIATSDDMIAAADEILRREPSLQFSRNRRGETPMFRAACYGKKKMFDKLQNKLRQVRTEDELKTYLKREDGSTILHMTVVAEHFDLALDIFNNHKYLAGERDKDGMTPLQLLCCNPTVFYNVNKRGYLARLIYKYISVEKHSPCLIPPLESIRRRKRRDHKATELAKLLIENDTYSIFHKDQAMQEDSISKEISKEKTEVEIQENAPQPPLMLAAKYGCMEIVKGILERYSPAIEYEDESGRNILHYALRHRQIEVVEYVEKHMEVPMRWLIRKLDNEGDSILHMVGMKEPHVQDSRNPALQLQESLLLFEKVKKICKSDYVKLRNKANQTAEKLFATKNEKLHEDAKEWMKRTSENCSIVAVLIATVAFAAAYTVPGGVDDKTGLPRFLDDPFFITFAIADVLSITFALTSVVVFLSVLTSPNRMIDFKQILPRKLMQAFTLMILSVTMMMLAFSATVVLTINEKGSWIKILLYSMASLPVSIFLLSFVKLYKGLWKALVESVALGWSNLPRKKTKDDEENKESVYDSSSFALEDEGYSV